MPIDTELKRQSALLTGLPIAPNGSVGMPDRPHVLWIYRGIGFFHTDAGTVKSPDFLGTVKGPDLLGAITSPDLLGTVRGK